MAMMRFKLLSTPHRRLDAVLLRASAQKCLSPAKLEKCVLVQGFICAGVSPVRFSVDLAQLLEELGRQHGTSYLRWPSWAGGS